VHAEVLATLSVIFFAIGMRGLSTWTGSNRPLIFWRLGRTGEFLHRALQTIILFGGLSLVIWSLISIAWWSTLVAFILAWAFIQLSRLSSYMDAFLCSAFVPALCAIAIVTLHFLTWLRMVKP
jgi:hypothetical protein